MRYLLFSMVACATFFSLGCASVAESLHKGPVGQMTPRPTGEGWVDLFSEENRPHWKNVSNEETVFEFNGEEMHVLGKTGTSYFAWMKEAFGDFELHIEFKVPAGANSGVFFRTDPADPVQGGFEIQVMGDYGLPPSRNGIGSLYDVASPMFNMLLPEGEWNSYDITCKGPNVVVVMNGWKILDLDLSKMTTPIGKFATPLAQLPQTGHIILQDHGAEVWYRNLVVRPL